MIPIIADISPFTRSLDDTRHMQESPRTIRANRSAALKAAEDQLRIAKEANQPMEAVLKKIEEILKYGLPNQTV